MGMDDPPFLFVQIGEVVLIYLRHFFDVARIHGEAIEQILATEVIEGGSNCLDIADNALRRMVSHVVDWSTKAVKYELSRYTDTQKTVLVRMQSRLRQTYFGKAGQGSGVLDP